MIRTGGGLFYASLWGVATGSAAFGSSGFINATNIVQPNNLVPQTFLNNPFPTGLVARLPDPARVRQLCWGRRSVFTTAATGPRIAPRGTSIFSANCREMSS